MIHVLILVSVLHQAASIPTINCSTFGNEKDLKELQIAHFCTTYVKDNDNCEAFEAGHELAGEHPDEVPYVGSRDSAEYIGCRNNKWTDPTYRVCRLNNTYQCDGISQCDTDECGCQVNADTHIFFCPNTTIIDPVSQQNVTVRGGCITDSFLCNGYSHCPHDHDESLCYNVHECSDRQFVPNYRVCDGYYHCKDFTDEDPAVCKEYNVSAKTPRKYIRCLDEDLKETKISITKVCDNNRDCFQQCGNYNTDPPEDCEEYNEDADCSFECDGGDVQIPSTWVCDTYPQCPHGEDECSGTCDSKYSKLWNNTDNPTALDKVNITDYYSGTPGFCEKFNDTHCPSKGKHFKCTNGKCIPQIGVCNTLDNCGDWSDEKGCPGRFYCENENPLYVPWENVCDEASDCLDGSDECQNCNFDILANDQSLIANNILACLVWIMGTIALIGNLILILSKGAELKKTGSKMNSVTKISTLLLVNLAMSDFLMGVYLIGIAAMERKLHGRYCQESKRWRSSFSCKLFGSICLLSSECSIFMMTLITFHRLISVVFPSKIATLGRRGLVSWYVAIVTVWIIVLCLAWVPNMHALQEYFVSEAYYENNSFFGRGDKKNLQEYAWKYNNSDGVRIPAEEVALSWDQLFYIIEESGVGSTYRYYGLMGFYSSHGVCLHKLFTTLDSPSWAYSLFLNVFNSLCFIFIVVSYSHILAVSKKLSSKGKGSGRMARKIQRLIFTDALCWIPTCIFAYLYIAGVNLPIVLYAYTAVLILPINSCLNPIVYTDVIDQVHVWLLKHVLRAGSDNYNSTGAHSHPDVKAHNPADQLTVLHDPTTIIADSNSTILQSTTLTTGSAVKTTSSLSRLSPSPYRSTNM